MSNFVRWLRGALGIGLTWAGLWIVIGILLGTVLWIIDPSDIGPGEGPAKALPILGLVGLLSGFSFAGLLSLAERKRTLGDLSIVRVSLWGMLGSAGVPLAMGTDGSMGLLTGAVGAVFAAGSLAIARRGVLPRGTTAESSSRMAPDLAAPPGSLHAQAASLPREAD